MGSLLRSRIAMAYHPDLGINPSSASIYVGWLDREHPFPNGRADSLFLQKLALHYCHRVRQSRRFHICQFCTERRFGIRLEIDGVVLTLGSAEVAVRDGNGRIYVAPDLLYHYVAEHQYLPPTEFIDAVSK
jgi:hypothetical protein